MRPGGFRGVGTVALRALAWAVLAALTVLGAALTFWILLGVALTGRPPIGKGIVAFVTVGVLGAGAYWLVARYVAPARLVWRVVVVAGAVVLFAGTVWALTAGDRALFLAREVTWGDSDVSDYEKFPAREVQAGPQTFVIPGGQATDRLGAIDYEVDGQVRRADFEELLAATHTTSFVVVRHGETVYEHYANGYDRDSIVTSFSVAKSVTSALVGIAIDEGLIGSVHDRMVDYLPEMRGRGLDDVTIRDLLLMSTGVRIVHQDEKSALRQLWPFHDEALSYYYPAMRAMALQLPPSGEPAGAAFKYNEYHPLLLGMILERSTHRPVAQYLQEKIWQPLGMEYPASWSLDSESDGFEKMESGLNGRAVDFAKFGLLFLHGGESNGRRIVSRAWVDESTAPDPADDRPWLVDEDWRDARGYYKYMWWGMATPDGGYYYSARGHLGQRVSVFPRDDTVVVRFGTDDAGVDSWDAVVATVAAKVGEDR